MEPIEKSDGQIEIFKGRSSNVSSIKRSSLKSEGFKNKVTNNIPDS